MKRERNNSSATGNPSRASSTSAKTKGNNKKSGSVNIDERGATEKTRTRHGHGMNNEGTNVNYEEER